MHPSGRISIDGPASAGKQRLVRCDDYDGDGFDDLVVISAGRSEPAMLTYYAGSRSGLVRAPVTRTLPGYEPR